MIQTHGLYCNDRLEQHRNKKPAKAIALAGFFYQIHSNRATD